MLDLKIPFETQDLHSAVWGFHEDIPLDTIWSMKFIDDWRKRSQKAKNDFIASLGQMVHLQQLEIGGFDAEEVVPLFQQLIRLPRLMDLSLTSWDCALLPPELGQLQGLRKLTISSSRCPAIPDFIRQLPHLRELDLITNVYEGNEDHLAALGGLPQLAKVFVWIRENQPNGFGHLRQIKSLHINRVMRPVTGLENLLNLEELHLQHGVWSGLNVLDLSGIRKMNRLRSLKLESDGEWLFPDSMADLTVLEELVFRESKRKSIPEAVRTLPGLKRLDLFQNELSTVPEWLGELQSLESIELAKNRLKALPASFSKLHRLTKISLDGNKLEQFPSCLVALPSIREISVVGNPIRHLPKARIQCPNLKVLDLSDTRLEQLSLALLGMPDTEIRIADTTLSWRSGRQSAEIFAAVSKAYEGKKCRPVLRLLALGNLPWALKIGTLEDLAIGLCDGHKTVRAYALAALHACLPNPFVTAAKPCRIALLGEAKGHPMKAYEAQLQAMGYTFTQGKPMEADIVVLGDRPGKKPVQCLQVGKTLATLAQLVGFLDAPSAGWLGRSPAEMPKVAANFQRLWTSHQPENLSLALELIKGGGFPDFVSLAEVTAVKLLHPARQVRKLAASFLRVKATPELKAFLLAQAKDLHSMDHYSLRQFLVRYPDFFGQEGEGFGRMAVLLKQRL